MTRDWLTLAFGILLVLLVLILSIWQNLGDGSSTVDQPAALAPGDEPAALALPEAAEAPQRSRPTTRPPVRQAAASPSDAQSGTESARERPAVPAARARQADVSVSVIHRHRFGSCEGTLRAGAAGLAFGTPNVQDAFELAFDEIDRFDVGHEPGQLRVRRRGGRTWNFIVRADNPAVLEALERQVAGARTAPAGAQTPAR